FPKIIPNFISKNLAGLMGYLIAEGSKTTFCNKDPEIIRDYIQRYKNTFGITPTTWGRDDGNVQVKASSIVKDFLNQNGIGDVTSSFKSVPKCVLKAPIRIQKEFLRCLFEGDGTVYSSSRDNKTRWTVSYGTVSKELAYNVFMM